MKIQIRFCGLLLLLIALCCSRQIPSEKLKGDRGFIGQSPSFEFEESSKNDLQIEFSNGNYEIIYKFLILYKSLYKCFSYCASFNGYYLNRKVQLKNKINHKYFWRKSN